jgi:CO/xanthine dehydrogenase FAD-binding subunit
MRNLREYHRPETLGEALSLLGRTHARTLPLAGGTQLMAEDSPDVEAVVDLEYLKLSYIESDDEGLRIGATTSLAELVDSPVVRVFADGILAEAARLAAGSLLRNQGRLAGALLARIENGDLPTVLLALDAEVLILRSEGSTRLPLAALYENLDIRGAVLTEARVPVPPAGARIRSFRVARSPADQAILTVAALTRQAKGVLAEYRVAAAGVGPRPKRLLKLESALAAVEPATEIFRATVAREVGKLELPGDLLASAEYRRAVLPVLVRRAVTGV